MMEPLKLNEIATWLAFFKWWDGQGQQGIRRVL